MNQNLSVDNDLQKAIDDITKNTNSDPVFADPVAAAPVAGPASSAGIVGPFPDPVPPKPVMPEPVAAPAPMPPATPFIETPIAPVTTAAPIAPVPEVPETPSFNTEPVAPFVEAEPTALDISQVKEAALRDLAPILSKLDIPAEQKFGIYKNVIENYRDSSVIEPAYHAAANIVDDRERGEALLYLVESIDKM